MAHLGPDHVRRSFRGMVERCRDCGFDLAGGLVEVVPTAHYLMGGIEFAADCSTAVPGLFVAGEDSGGVHGANRLGGNGVANSTVFGGVAGETMAAWVKHEAHARETDRDAVEAAMAACRHPLSQPPGDLSEIRESLWDLMWADVGILRDASGLSRARERLRELDERLDRTGVDGSDLRFNLTWHDWLNLKSQVLVSRAITEAAMAREDSCGAHFREDHPGRGPVEQSAYTRLSQVEGRFRVARAPVAFTRVRPGATLLEN